MPIAHELEIPLLYPHYVYEFCMCRHVDELDRIHRTTNTVNNLTWNIKAPGWAKVRRRLLRNQKFIQILDMLIHSPVIQ